MVWIFERLAARLICEPATTTAHAAPNRAAKYQVKFRGLLNIPFSPVHILRTATNAAGDPWLPGRRRGNPRIRFVGSFSSHCAPREGLRSRAAEQRDELAPPK